MNDRTDWTTTLAVAALACLLAMVGITAATGVSQEAFEVFRDPVVYAADLRAHPFTLRALFALDSAFLVLYTALFISFGRRVATPATRTLVNLAIGALFATAVLDMIEDHHILAMVHGVEVGADPTAGQLAFQHTLSQVKFNASYLGLFLLGLAVPRDTLTGKTLAVLLTIGTLAQGAWLYAAPVALLALGNFGRWFSFVVGFVLMIGVARQQVAGAAATDAPA